MYLNKSLIDKLGTEITNDLQLDSHAYRAVKQSIKRVIHEQWEELSLSEKSGPHLWEFLHWLAIVSDREKKPALYMRALQILSDGHPCKSICRPHLKQNLRKIQLKDYGTNFEHSVELHNFVNQKLGKDNFSVSRAKEKYDLDCDECKFSPLEKNRNSRGVHENDFHENFDGYAGTKKGLSNQYQEETFYYPYEYRKRT